MKSKLINDEEQKTFALVFDKGDEFISVLTAFANDHDLDASHFTAIGAFRDAVLGFFRPGEERLQKDLDQRADGGALAHRGHSP